MDRVGDHLLTSARFAADEHRGVGPRHLRHLLVDLLNRRAVADDVAEGIALAQLVAQVFVLLGQLVAVRFDHPADFDGLRDHRGDDAVELERALVVAIGFEGQHDLDRAGGAPAQHDRHRDEGQFALIAARPLGRRRREVGLLADPRHDHRLGRVDDPFGDAAAVAAVAAPLTGQLDAARRLHVNVLAVPVDEHDRAAGDLVPAFEDVEHRMQRRLEIQDARERLADLEQRRQPPCLVCVVFRWTDTRVGHEPLIVQDCRTFVSLGVECGTKASHRRGRGGRRAIFSAPQRSPR